MVLRHRGQPSGCRVVRLLAAVLSALWLELPGRSLLGVQAQEDASPPETEGSAPVEVEVEAEGEDSSSVGGDDAPADAPADAASGEAFADSARELQDKLAQLKALLDAKGGDADPQLKERLAGLEDQLKGLGLDGLTGGAGSNKELTEFLSGCVVLTMRRVGFQRPSTVGNLRRLADKKFTTEQASKIDFFKMVAVCVSDFTEEQYADYKQGKVKVLPKAMLDEAKKPEAVKKVLDIDAEIWGELHHVAGILIEQFAPSGDKPQTWYGWLAAVPLLGMIGYLAFRFREMQKKDTAKKDKASKKKR